ncbi:MAG: flagellar hook-length control protein FliK [Campylobacterota bacterium]|nr:flagellar hook-length control protein FliK [Campylobacterota bacterium]
MISLDLKPETTSSSPLSLANSDEKPTLNFSELLKGMNAKKDGKVIQNGALILSLGSEEKEGKSLKTSTKSDVLLSLLKNDESKSIEVKEPLEINPKLTATLSVKELKVLLSHAKEYLKSKIVQSDDYKQSQIKELPKTLKGLALLAKKVGVDVSKITLQDVQPEVETKKLKTQTKEFRVENKQPQNQEVKRQEHIKVDERKIEFSKEIKSTPLFKVQVSTEHTTEQFVQTKQFKVEEKTPKERANETLKLLLKGEKPSQSNLSLTADFSVATAKVIAPSATSESTKALESLLHTQSDSTEKETLLGATNSSKIDGITTHKADSFEVKLNEAKQMIRYLSADVKTAIEDYKSPFTRVKIQLNPQKLGEIDLTVVQRGKNLHLNLSSNSTAINTLSTNANELRVQLNNSGVNNATLNFSNQSDSNNQSFGQQNSQHEKEAHEEYGILQQFENEENSEEILSSLEIVVPSYA